MFSRLFEDFSMLFLGEKLKLLELVKDLGVLFDFYLIYDYYIISIVLLCFFKFF